jgi:hypothetical protein
MKRLVVLPATPMPAGWNTTARRMSNGPNGQPAARGTWVMTCQSLHPTGVNTYASEAVLVQMDVHADGSFVGEFESKIATTHVRVPVFGTLRVGDASTITGEMQSPAFAGTIIAKGLLFGEGKEFMAIPVGNWDGTTLKLNAYDGCRGIRIGR